MVEDYSLPIPLGRILFPGEENDRQEFIIPMPRSALFVRSIMMIAAHRFCPGGEHREIGVRSGELKLDTLLTRGERNPP